MKTQQELSLAERLDRLRENPVLRTPQYFTSPIRTFDHVLLLYMQNTCNDGMVEVLALPDNAHKIKATHWIVEIVLTEFANRAPEIYHANARRFEGSTPEEALEKAEWAIGLEKLSGVLE